MMKTEDGQEQDKYTSKRAADKTRESVFLRTPFLKPDTTSRDEKLSDADLMRIHLHILVKNFKWLGNIVHVNSASEFDGYVRLIDLFVQFKDNERIIPLGFEICLTQTEPEIEAQIRAVMEEVKDGQEFAVKYFDSPFTGKQKNVKMPKVLFAWTFSDARAILELVARASASSQEASVSNRPLKQKFVERTLLQLNLYKKSAVFAKNVEFAEMNETLHKLIKTSSEETVSSGFR